jgi:hypothetical protein
VKRKQHEEIEERCAHCLFWKRSTPHSDTGECMATKLQNDGEGGRQSPFLMFIRPIPEKLETRSYFGCTVFQPGRENIEADIARRKRPATNAFSPT